jgi:hypothetical protein
LKTKKEKKKSCWRFNEILQDQNKFVIENEVYWNLGLSTEKGELSIAWINLGNGQIIGINI